MNITLNPRSTKEGRNEVVLSWIVTNETIEEQRISIAAILPPTTKTTETRFAATDTAATTTLPTRDRASATRYKHPAYLTHALVILVILTCSNFTGNDWLWRTSPKYFYPQGINTTTTRTYTDADSSPGPTPSRLKECEIQSRNDTLPVPLGCVFVFSMKQNGLGSQLMNLFANWIYSREVLGRPYFLVDETRYSRYTIGGKGVLEGFFSPQSQFLWFRRPEQRQALNALLPPGHWTLEDWYKFNITQRGWLGEQALTTKDGGVDDDILVADVHTLHRPIVRYYRSLPGGHAQHLYPRLVDTMCPTLQFNPTAQASMAKRRQEYGIPTNLPSPSVAFHIRRTDKLWAESPLYPAGDYVAKALQLAGEQKQSNNSSPHTYFRTCFLATDDVDVIDELRSALQAARMTCTLQTIASADRLVQNISLDNYNRRYDPDGALSFITELDMLIRSTYFVGTFNSNVAAWVAVLRACARQRRNSPTLADDHDFRTHFARSYGVDGDEWYLR